MRKDKIKKGKKRKEKKNLIGVNHSLQQPAVLEQRELGKVIDKYETRLKQENIRLYGSLYKNLSFCVAPTELLSKSG